MATFDTPLTALPVPEAAPAASPTAPSYRSATTGRRTLGALATVEPDDGFGDYFAVLLAVASLPLLALREAIRRRRAERGGAREHSR